MAWIAAAAIAAGLLQSNMQQQSAGAQSRQGALANARPQQDPANFQPTGNAFFDAPFNTTDKDTPAPTTRQPRQPRPTSRNEGPVQQQGNTVEGNMQQAQQLAMTLQQALQGQQAQQQAGQAARLQAMQGMRPSAAAPFTPTASRFQDPRLAQLLGQRF